MTFISYLLQIQMGKLVKIVVLVFIYLMFMVTFSKFLFFLPNLFSMCRYEYSHTTNRLWRKNRAGSNSPLGQILPVCAGVDLNRNFGHHWGTLSLDPRVGTKMLCLETYMGSKPFSEKESRAIRRFIMSQPSGTFEVIYNILERAWKE